MAIAPNDESSIKALINEIFLFSDGDFDAQSVDDLFSLLMAADDAYGRGTPILQDDQYDALTQYLQTADPDNTYFLGVGSAVRGSKVKLPYTMGSLTQAYLGGDVEKWVADYKLNSEIILITEKLDGISALIVYDAKGDLQIAYSRGDGIEGADITRHVSKIASIPKNVGEALVVRAEIIFKKSVWEVVKTQIKRSGGAFYKNARNATAGLMNASESDPIAYANLSIVAYEILNQSHDKLKQIAKLRKLKFEVPYSEGLVGKLCTDDELTAVLNKIRSSTDFEIDGIVLDVNSDFIRSKMKTSGLNPEFARKYKVADASNMAIAKVIEVQWNISKNGYLKPRVKIEPTELVGVTVQHATGFNANFIYQNKISEGTTIRITRSGDVIPFIVGVVEPAIKNGDRFDEYFNEVLAEQFGEGSWDWTSTGVDAVLKDAGSNETVQLEQLIDFFGKIGTEYLGEGNLKTIFDAGFKTIKDVIMMSEFEWVSLVGANGKKIFKSLREKTKNVAWYIIAGAHPAFGRGVGVRKMKKLYDAFNGDMKKLGVIQEIMAVEGFEFKTASKISNGFVNSFIAFLTDTQGYITFATYEAPKTGGLSGQSFLFTGFRSAELEAKIVELGGKISSSVSSKLTYLVAADPTETSGKLTKARKDGVKIISRDQLVDMLGA